MVPFLRPIAAIVYVYSSFLLPLCSLFFSCVRNIHFAPAHSKPKSINETNRLCILQKARIYNACVTRQKERIQEWDATEIERNVSGSLKKGKEREREREEEQMHKSAMIDVVVGILYAERTNAAGMVGRRLFDAILPIPLQRIYIADAMDMDMVHTV